MIKKILFVSSFLLSSAVVSYGQTITTFAGNGTATYSGDNVAATATSLNNPYGVAVDVSNGNVYIADYGNHRIRKVDGTTGIITTVAGTGTGTYSGDNGPATAAQIQYPRGITVDPSGNVVFSDYGNNRIRKVNMTTGIITTVAGVGGIPTYVATDDGGPATDAHLAFAWGVVYDAAGNLYICDNQNCRIRKVNTSGIISTIAGTGSCTFAGDGGQASVAKLQYPSGIGVDNSGNIYVADDGNNRLRKIDASGVITTLAGSAVYGFSGDGGPSTAAKLYVPRAVATDGPGNIYICDMNNNRVRKINIFGIISTFAGNGVGAYAGDGGLPTDASINLTTGIAIDPTHGRYYICDNDNNRIRVINTFHNPYFSGGARQVAPVCEGGAKNLDTLLAVDDIDVSQTETWTLLTAPAHGAASVAYVTSSTGVTNVPVGLNYTASLGYSGADSFKVRIFDGTYSDTTLIVMNVLPLAPNAGTIAGADSLCPRDTLTFTDTVAGGTWSSSNDTIATVSAGGLVTGVNPGADTIRYTVTNPCGSTTISFPVIIRDDTNFCPGVGIASVNKNSELLTVFPNPTSGTVSIHMGSNYKEDVWFVISNVTGQKVARIKGATNKNLDIDLSDKPAGIYYLSATGEHERHTRKIVLSR